MATVLHGKDGSAKVNGTAVAFIDSWDANVDTNYDDITAMDSSGWQNLMLGIKKISGSIKVRHASGDTNGQAILSANAFGGTAVSLSLLDGAGTANAMAGSAFLKLAVSASHASPEEATYSFESHGAWTYTAP